MLLPPAVSAAVLQRPACNPPCFEFSSDFLFPQTHLPLTGLAAANIADTYPLPTCKDTILTCIYDVYWIIGHHWARDIRVLLLENC